MAAGLRIYIDDSGEKEYGDKTSRYFVYAGVVVDRSEEQPLSDAIDDLKRTTFKTTGVEIKSNWLRIPKERKERYLDPFNISAEALTSFVDQMYDIMKSGKLTYVAAAIDKRQMIETYGSAHAHYPSSLAYQFILQRYQKHCARLGVEGYITIDDMSGSSPKKNQWRDLLRSQHDRLKKDGCRFTKMRFENISDRPLFAPSNRFNLLQVADLVAYNVFRQFRDHGTEWDRVDVMSVPLYGRLGLLIRRFMLGENGQLAGWGIVKWPRKSAQRWRVKEATPGS